MKESMKQTFQLNIDIINYSYKTINCLRKQNYYKGMQYSSKAIDTIMKNLNNLMADQDYFNQQYDLFNIAYVNQMLGSLMDAQENKDYVLVADLYDLQLIPFLIRIQEYIVSKEDFTFDEILYMNNINYLKNRNPEVATLIESSEHPMHLLEKEYAIEYTSSGQITLGVDENGKKYYFHSNNNATAEADILAQEWFDTEVSDYYIYGLGLGYHIRELVELDGSITIQVFESDINVLQLACAFVELKDIFLCDRIQIIYDPDFSKLEVAMNKQSDSSSLVLHSPSVRNIRISSVREKLEDYFISYHSIKNQLHSLNSNFRNNISQVKAPVDKLREKFYGKDLFIIAAGPSLDKNFFELKHLNHNSLVLATGTVLKKLVNAGIIPDYVIISDGNEMVYEQIRDMENSNIPLLLMSTAYHKIAKEYEGEKYLIFQEGYGKAEEYAKKLNYCLFQTGGSVTTIAMDIGIKFQCKRIIFVGLDLAYTNNQYHSSGTAAKNTVAQDFLRSVESIDGGQVKTGKNLDIYRKWIEERIKNINDIEFINATEGGANIKGTQIKSLRDVIEKLNS